MTGLARPRGRDPSPQWSTAATAATAATATTATTTAITASAGTADVATFTADIQLLPPPLPPKDAITVASCSCHVLLLEPLARGYIDQGAGEADVTVRRPTACRTPALVAGLLLAGMGDVLVHPQVAESDLSVLGS